MNPLLEASRLVDAALKLSHTKFSLEEYCFDKQLAFIQDKAPFKTAVCSRRAGKTVGCAADLTFTANTKAKIVCVYITLSRSNAKKIIWPVLCELNREFNLGGKINETELSIRYPNGSIIYCTGAKDKQEVEKVRGLPIFKCYIDECQSFRPYIKGLINDVVAPALFDYSGTLCLIGTPGPVPSGYFYKCTQDSQWSHHEWTMHHNPWLQIKSGKTADQIIERELIRKGVSLDDPTIQRECFGRWVLDQSVLVFKYDPKRNHFNSRVGPPPTAGVWHYVCGIDIGYDDADAISVLGYNDKLNAVYLLEESVETKQGITELVGRISQVIDKYAPEKIVMDTGGLGKKIAEEITGRYSILIEAAEKQRKLEFIELLNDALRTNRFYADRESRFAQDCQLLEWERDVDTDEDDDRSTATKRKFVNERPRISDSYHSDICDSVLYAFRESFHWLWAPEEKEIKAGTAEWLAQQEKEMESIAIERAQESVKDIWAEPLEKAWGETDDHRRIRQIFNDRQKT